MAFKVRECLVADAEETSRCALKDSLSFESGWGVRHNGKRRESTEILKIHRLPNRRNDKAGEAQFYFSFSLSLANIHV